MLDPNLKHNRTGVRSLYVVFFYQSQRVFSRCVYLLSVYTYKRKFSFPMFYCCKEQETGHTARVYVTFRDSNTNMAVM